MTRLGRRGILIAAVVFVAGQACALVLAGGARTATGPAPPTTTVVATTNATPTPAQPAPDQPPAAASTPKTTSKPKTASKSKTASKAKTTSKTHSALTTTKPAPSTSTTSSGSGNATSPTTATPSSTTHSSAAASTAASRSAVSNARAAAARRASAEARTAARKKAKDSEAKIRAAELKAVLGPVPKPKYKLTPPGGGAHPRTPIHHFIYLLQENHTFDNYFGTYGHGAVGIPKNVCMPLNLSNPKAGCIKPFHLGGRAVSDLGHNPVVFRGQYNNGKMNGFANILRLEDEDPTEVMGYYDGSDIPYYWNLAGNEVLFDHFFSSAGDGSGANHFYWVGAYPADPHDAPPGGFTLPTIFDELEKAGISWKFYVSNYDPKITFRNHAAEEGDRDSQVVWVPLLDYARFIDDPKLAKHIVPLSQYYKDLADGTLPAVSYIAPSGASEHPPGSIQSGERFVRTLINNLMASSSWTSSAFLLAYDDWGGWYDSVKPPQVDAFGYGFRVPAILVSPYAKKGFVDHTVLDFTSGLKFIEENWGLAPLTTRDARANNLTSAFDFSAPPRPPQIISATRLTPAPTKTNTAIIYPAYALAAALVILLALVAWVRSVRRRVPRAGSPRDAET